MKRGSSVLTGLVALALGAVGWAWWGASDPAVELAPVSAPVARPEPPEARQPMEPTEEPEPIGQAPEPPSERRPAKTPEERAAHNAQMRAHWEEGAKTGSFAVDLVVNTVSIAWFCRMGVAPVFDQALPMAKAHPESESAPDMVEMLDGIQDKWWFRTCVWVSPLVARDLTSPP